MKDDECVFESIIHGLAHRFKLFVFLLIETMVPNGWRCIGLKCFKLHTHYRYPWYYPWGLKDYRTWREAHDYCENVHSVSVHEVTFKEPSILLAEGDAEFQVVHDMISGKSKYLPVNCNNDSTEGDWTCTTNSGETVGMSRGTHSSFCFL